MSDGISHTVTTVGNRFVREKTVIQIVCGCDSKYYGEIAPPYLQLPPFSIGEALTVPFVLVCFMSRQAITLYYIK